MATNNTKETLFASDLLVHIGSQEIESVLPTASEYTKQLYDQVDECFIGLFQKFMDIFLPCMPHLYLSKRCEFGEFNCLKNSSWSSFTY